MLQLSFLNVNKSPVWLVDPSYIIGSNDKSDIVLGHSSINARHAEISVEGENIYVSPCDSKSEVWVDGERVFEKCSLNRQSELRLGELTLALTDPKSRKQEPAAARADQGWYLQAKTTALATKRFDIDGESILGRAKECDICLGVAHLSRKHARLRPLSQGLEVEDLNSSNGTFLNGKKIHKAVAKEGDELRFDTLSFRVSHIRQQQEEGSTTCLRQAISQEDIAKQAAQIKGKPAPAKPVRSAAVKPSKPTSASTPTKSAARSDNAQGSLAVLFVGIAVVATLTVAGIVFLMT